MAQTAKTDRHHRREPATLTDQSSNGPSIRCRYLLYRPRKQRGQVKLLNSLALRPSGTCLISYPINHDSLKRASLFPVFACCCFSVIAVVSGSPAKGRCSRCLSLSSIPVGRCRIAGKIRWSTKKNSWLRCNSRWRGCWQIPTEMRRQRSILKAAVGQTGIRCEQMSYLAQLFSLLLLASDYR